MQLSQIKLRRKIDTVIPILTLGLSVFGLIMILSSSQIQAAETTGNAYYFFIRQLVAWIIGAGVFFYFMKVPLDGLYHNRNLFLISALILLALVFFPIIGPKIAGVHRWIDIGFLRFQPAEVVKLLLILYFAGNLAAKERDVQDPIKTLIPFICVLGLVVGLIMLQPDMGTALVIIISSLTILFIAEANIWQYVALIIVGALLLLVVIYKAPYRASRLTAFLNKNSSQQDKLGSAYHGNQAQIAIGTGGLWGVGFGQGVSKYSFLPESHNDSIFAVIAEELGFIRTMIVVLAYFYLAWRGYLITRAANSRYVKLITAGITTAIIGQMLINVGGMLGVLPLTGVPLPLISYG
ncbi:MAG: putative lipid II flippase FtsW, partial [Candidatus Berkelbacteria bacterium]|nr:putative lipid II flippase FtsW [Candidatus Berkelbacteria bacterium]